MAISNYLENKILDATLRGIPYSTPDVVYLALYTNDPTDNGTGIEVSSGGYQRRAITFNEPMSGTISNATSIQMPVATGDWGAVTHIGIMDNLTNGELLYHGALDVPQHVQANNQLIINEGSLTITLD